MKLLRQERLTRLYQQQYTLGRISKSRDCTAIAKTGNIASLCQGIPHDKVLDIGAGEGAVIQRLSRLGFARDFYALEITPGAVTGIQSRSIEHLREVGVFDGYTIPYDSRTFDLALLTHVLEHVEHPRQLLWEAGRVADHVYIEVPLEDNRRMGRDFRPTEVGHINFFSFKTIRFLVQSCDLTVIRQEIRNPLMPTGLSIESAKWLIREMFLRTVPKLGSYLTTYNCGLVCRCRPSGQEIYGMRAGNP